VSTLGYSISAEAEVDSARSEDKRSEIHDGDCEACNEDFRPEFVVLQRPHWRNYSTIPLNKEVKHIAANEKYREMRGSDQREVLVTTGSEYPVRPHVD
jgi:hypothetical protein